MSHPFVHSGGGHHQKQCSGQRSTKNVPDKNHLHLHLLLFCIQALMPLSSGCEAAVTAQRGDALHSPPAAGPNDCRTTWAALSGGPRQSSLIIITITIRHYGGQQDIPISKCRQTKSLWKVLFQSVPIVRVALMEPRRRNVRAARRILPPYDTIHPTLTLRKSIITEQYRCSVV